MPLAAHSESWELQVVVVFQPVALAGPDFLSGFRAALVDVLESPPRGRARWVTLPAPVLSLGAAETPAVGPSGPVAPPYVLPVDALAWDVLPGWDRRFRLCCRCRAAIDTLLAGARSIRRECARLWVNAGDGAPEVRIMVTIDRPRVAGVDVTFRALRQLLVEFGKELAPADGHERVSGSPYGVRLCWMLLEPERKPAPEEPGSKRPASGSTEARAYRSMVDGTRRREERPELPGPRGDRMAVEKIEGLLGLGNLRWAGGLLRDLASDPYGLAGIDPVEGGAPTEVRDLDRELAWTLLGGPRMCEWAREWFQQEGVGTGVGGRDRGEGRVLPHLVASSLTGGSAEALRREGPAPPPEEPPPTGLCASSSLADPQTWFEALRRGLHHPWDTVPLHLSSPPSTLADTILLFHVATAALVDVCPREDTLPLYLAWCDRALTRAYLGFIQQGQVDGMIRSALWVGAVSALRAAVSRERPGGQCPELTGRLERAGGRVANAVALLRNAGRGPTAATVEEAWERVHALAVMVPRGDDAGEQGHLFRRELWALLHASAASPAGESDPVPPPRGVFVSGHPGPGTRRPFLPRVLRFPGAPEADPGTPPAWEVVDLDLESAPPAYPPTPHALLLPPAGSVPRTAATAPSAECPTVFELAELVPVSLKDGRLPAPGAHPGLSDGYAGTRSGPVEPSEPLRQFPVAMPRMKPSASPPEDGLGRVFVNHPFDSPYRRFEAILHLVIESAVAADPTGPPQLRVSRSNCPPHLDRLTHLDEQLTAASWSIHDLCRHQGGGARNLARMNMPLELGLALKEFRSEPWRVLVLVDGGSPLDAYLSDVRASKGFLMRAYRGRRGFVQALVDALWVWGFRAGHHTVQEWIRMSGDPGRGGNG